MISKKKVMYSVTIVLGLFFILGILQISDTSKYMSVNGNDIKNEKIKVIIDPGHGGVDCGAVASDSTLEKDINLQIALMLDEMLRMAGAETILTRDTDVSIHDITANTIRAKKVSDIHNRFKIIESNPDKIFVSIHQNTYSDSKYKGAQLFYSPNNSESAELAKLIQNSVSSNLQKDNDREIKKCTTDVYLVYHAKSTAVLCECGFLSNREELNNLKNPEYQKQIAFCIFQGILDYYSSEVP